MPSLMLNKKNTAPLAKKLRAIVYLACLPASPLWALQPMNDAALSGVSGQDGLTLNISAPQITAQSMAWDVDPDGFDVDGSGGINTAEEGFASTLQFDGVSARSVDASGAVVGAAPVQILQTLDVGAEDVSGLPLLNYHIATNRVRLQSDNQRITSQPAVEDRSFGKWALDAPLSMTIRNHGLFSTTYDKAYVRGEVGRSNPETGEVLEYANLFYRQAWHAHSYMTMHNFYAKWEMPSGTLGINDEGILWKTGYAGDWDNPANDSGRTISESDLINIAFDFEYLYKFPVHYSGGAGEDFVVTSNDRGLMHFGWLGSLRDVELKWRPGGTWYGLTAGPGSIGDIYDVSNKSGGLNLSATWDYVTQSQAINDLADASKEFRWQLGETSDVCPGGICAPGQDASRVNFELRDWVIWGKRTSEDNLNGSYDYGNGLHTKPAASHFPLIAIDVINGAGQGAAGLCWGFAYNGPSATCSANNSQFINVQPGNIGSSYPAELRHADDAGGLAIHIRDGQLQTYSRSIRLLERNASMQTPDLDGNGSPGRDFNWGLIYALANVDGSFYLYPGGNSGDTAGGSRNYGVIADITLMSQTFDETNPLQQGFNWDHGTHLLIADTDMDGDDITGETRDSLGIGFASSSFLLAANDTRIMLKNHWNASDYYEGGIDLTSPVARFHYKATFGGGVLPDNGGSYGVGPSIVKGAFLDVNLEGAANIRFSPSNPADTWDASGQYTGIYNTSRNYLGYSAALRLGTLPNNAEGIGGNASSGQYGTYLSLAEPSRKEVAWRFANVNGDIAFTNGMIDVRGTNEDADLKPKMVLANNMLIGYAAAGRTTDGFGDMTIPATHSYSGPTGRELTTNMMLGDQTLGTAVIPSAQVYSSITLTPQ
ncbi:MAG: DUF6160 family protein [Pseudomonadota bacterium]|uniref:DUF6160 family protein n=1 Tax=Alcanivorax sp. TaxID=1872427 RepID=UPI0025B84B33|nr:DUF6160 family protein [Alcanivorax sp.]MED5238241.1 DUF6160 family protein [Pseudomonadota bacterium]MEE3320087.1 DUF6160 family protein [Pseudomonadota bacterium]